MEDYKAKPREDEYSHVDRFSIFALKRCLPNYQPFRHYEPEKEPKGHPSKPQKQISEIIQSYII